MAVEESVAAMEARAIAEKKPGRRNKLGGLSSVKWKRCRRMSFKSGTLLVD
jgi:hypothetical protein